MFFQLLFIHLYRYPLKYNPQTSPLPAHVSPRKLCTQAAQTVSKLMRLYKRSYGLRQICNIVVYIAHSACTIHLLNLPEKNAKRDITHGFKHLEEIAEGWPCARRTLTVLSLQVRNWKIELPEEAATVLARTDRKFGRISPPRSPPELPSASPVSVMHAPPQLPPHLQQQQNHVQMQQLQQRQQFQQPQGQTTMPGQIWQNPSFFTTTSAMQNGVPLAPNGSVQSPARLNGTNMYRLPEQIEPPTQRQQALPQQQTPHTQFPRAPLPTGNMHQPTTDVPYLSHANFAPTPSTSTATRGSQSVSPSALTSRMQMQQQGASNMTTPLVTPSASFGGIEELLREGQDWWVADQAQVASGFNNWATYDGAAETGKWMGANGGSLHASLSGNSMIEMAKSAGASGGRGRKRSLTMEGGDGGFPGLMGNGEMGWGGGVAQAYDEDEWYM
ncbi:hypothetical protein MRB53_038935 [Persea americana]|nr:hypothetical protein MRB53_038935 [Persea americana]